MYVSNLLCMQLYNSCLQWVLQLTELSALALVWFWVGLEMEMEIWTQHGYHTLIHEWQCYASRSKYLWSEKIWAESQLSPIVATPINLV